MSKETRSEKRPEAYCDFCSTKTPHLYERLALTAGLRHERSVFHATTNGPENAAETRGRPSMILASRPRNSTEGTMAAPLT